MKLIVKPFVLIVISTQLFVSCFAEPEPSFEAWLNEVTLDELIIDDYTIRETVQEIISQGKIISESDKNPVIKIGDPVFRVSASNSFNNLSSEDLSFIEKSISELQKNWLNSFHIDHENVKTTLRLREVTLADSIRYAALSIGMGVSITGNTITLFPNNDYTMAIVDIPESPGFWNYSEIKNLLSRYGNEISDSRLLILRRRAEFDNAVSDFDRAIGVIQKAKQENLSIEDIERLL